MEDVYGNLISQQAMENDKKILLLVLDGLGDCDNSGRGTALEIANTPNMDALAKRSALGLSIPVATAITPGSGPGHLGLFGYDPLVYQIGRGALSALGIEFPLKGGDVAARLNFCTLDKGGNVVDRRAGRISTEENQRVIQKLKSGVKAPAGVEVFFETESEHRALMVLRGQGLDDNVGDTDPQLVGVQPLDPSRGEHATSKTAKIAKDILDQVKQLLKDEPKANFMLCRGFAGMPNWPMFPDRYKLNPAAVAGYPMYRGVSRLVGIPVFSTPTSAEDICREAAKALKEYNFVFAHYKYTDKTGEDGDVNAKVKVIEDMDKALPLLLGENEPDVLIITGDHSTPPSMKSHSWHPVPLMMKAPHIRRLTDGGFNERSCQTGELGTITAKEILPLALAQADKLQKFGA
jgi:2,3-bisphosphoglycerate-independent phosphoglycerate mutase